jgi:hypothetical protein
LVFAQQLERPLDLGRFMVEMAQSIMAKLLLFLAALLSTASGSNLRRRTITTEQFLLASDAAKPITLDIQTAKSSRRNQTAP